MRLRAPVLPAGSALSALTAPLAISLISGLFCGDALAQAPSDPAASGSTANLVEGLDNSEEADLHFRLGVDALRSGDYRQALVHLLHSNRLAPNKNVIYNIAIAYEQLGQYPEAWRHYSDYVALEQDPARRKAAEDARARIQNKVALLKVQTRPEGAVIYVDRKNLGARGLSPRSLALEPGEHTIIAELDGYEVAESKPVNVQLGSESVVIIDMRQILGTVSLEGSPRGATVRLGDENGDVVGLLPGVLDLPPGPQMLVISQPGYQTTRQLVTVVPQQNVQALVNLPLVTGTLVVNAAERGARIEIDGVAAGFTPAVLPAVPAGNHTLTVTLPGYRPFEEGIRIEPDKQTEVTARMRSMQEVTAASRAAQAIEDAPASVSLISQEEIRAFGYETLYDALGGTRGVYQTDDLIYQYLGFRGFSRLGDYGNRVLVTLDGHTMNDDQSGSSYVGYDLMSDLSDVERIEVVRGPGSALYGTNAFFGVLNLVTRDKATMNRPSVSLAADGSRTARLRAGVSGKSANGLGGWLSLGGVYSQGDDYQFPEFVTVAGVDGATENNDGVSAHADGQQSGTISGKAWLGDVTVQGFLNSREKRIPNGAYDTILADERAHASDTRGFFELRYEPEFNDKLRMYSRVYLDYYAYEAVYPYDDDTGIVTDSWDGAWAGVEPRIVATPTPWLSLTAGAEARFDYLADIQSQTKLEEGEPAEVYLQESPTFQTYSAYAVAQANAGELLDASIGARYDSFRYATTDTSDPEDQQSINPRIALIFKPNAANVVKVLGGKAFRAPSPYELNYNDEGYTQLPAPSDITPETILTGELEYGHRFSEVVNLAGSVYYNQISNLIDTADLGPSEFDPTYEVYQYDNVDEQVKTVGEEFEVRRNWRDGWMLAFTQSFQHTRAGTFSDGYELTNSPAHLLSLKAATPFGSSTNASLATRVRYESSRLTTDEATRTANALLWDLTVTGQVPVAHLTYGLGVRNLLDWNVEHPGNYDYRQLTQPQPGRTFWATTTVSF